jgi:hypothetical protein
MNIEDIVYKIGRGLIQSWNNGEIEKIIGYMSENVVVTSPHIKLFYPLNNDNKIVGKVKLSEYWKNLVQIGGNFKLTLIEFKKENNKLTIICSLNNRKEKMHTICLYNEYGKVVSLDFDYV